MLWVVEVWGLWFCVCTSDVKIMFLCVYKGMSDYCIFVDVQTWMSTLQSAAKSLSQRRACVASTHVGCVRQTVWVHAGGSVFWEKNHVDRGCSVFGFCDCKCDFMMNICFNHFCVLMPSVILRSTTIANCNRTVNWPKSKSRADWQKSRERLILQSATSWWILFLIVWYF